MREYHPGQSVHTLCRLFGKTRQAFYDHSWRQADHHLEEHFILDQIMELRAQVPGMGLMALHKALKNKLEGHHILIGRDRLYTILRQHNLLLKPTRKYTRTTDSNHSFRKWPSLLCDLTVDQPSQLWVSDITYIRTLTGFNYLSLVTDAYSRKIVGYHLSHYLKAQGAISALKKAINTLNGKHPHLIHHSDRGIQYCCHEYVAILQAHQINISMTQTGSPYENPIAERVNGILKTQMGLNKTFQGYQEAVVAVSNAIDAYNRIRPHMSCNYLTPNEAHLKTGILPKKWKPRPKQMVSLQP